MNHYFLFATAWPSLGWQRRRLLGLVLFTALLSLPISAHAGFQVLANFDYSGDAAGSAASPYSSLVMDNSGNLYGTTELGGTYGDGTIFKLSPDGTLTTLVSFDGSNGADLACPRSWPVRSFPLFFVCRGPAASSKGISEALRNRGLIAPIRRSATARGT